MKTTVRSRKLKLPVFILILAMLVMLLPITASAGLATNNVAVYIENVGYEEDTTSYWEGHDAKWVYETMAGTPFPDNTIYLVNGKVGTVEASSYTVYDGDYLAFYHVNDPDDTFAGMDPTTVLMCKGRIYTISATGIKGQVQNFDMNAPYTEDDTTIDFFEYVSGVKGSQITGSIPAGIDAVYVDGGDHDSIIPVEYEIDYGHADFASAVTLMKATVTATANTITSSAVSPSYSTIDSQLSTLNGAVGQDAEADAAIDLGLTLHNLGYNANYDTRADIIYFNGSVASDVPFDADIFTYNLVSTASGVPIPASFLMKLSPKVAANIDDPADITVTGAYDYRISQASGLFLINVEQNAAGTYALSVTLSNSPYHTNTYVYNYTCAAPTVPGDGVTAYLPGAGQFVNEGVTTGGWGDAFDSSGTALKPFVNRYSSTGVSLGAFGGCAVFDFGPPTKVGGSVTSGIYNDDDNEFGVDFILYGNAFGNWAEPGCVQVAEDTDEDDEPDAWYDIAGSLHYEDDTMWKYTPIYTNPTPGDDDPSKSPGYAGTIATGGVPYTYTYSYLGGDPAATGSGSGTVTYNPFHKHSWFSLWCNYFTNRNGFGADGLANIPTFNSDYVTYNWDDSAGSTLAMTGVNLNTDDTANDTFLFGYCDAHANGGTPTSTQENPYTTGRTTGGDPIDISWAVYPAGTIISSVDVSGQPVDLDSIRYVRVYTGVQAMQGAFGESSTEVTSVYRADTNTGSGAAVTTPTVELIIGTQTIPVTVNNMDTTTMATVSAIAALEGVSTFSVRVTDASANYIYVNNTSISSGNTVTLNVPSGGSTQNIRIITQTTNYSPFITLVKAS